MRLPGTGVGKLLVRVFCQAGDDFAWFGTTQSKSRLNFLDLLRAGYTDYVVNEMPQLRSEVARDTGRQGRNHRPSIRQHPALAAIADCPSPQHKLLHHEIPIVLEARIGRNLSPNILETFQLGNLLAQLSYHTLLLRILAQKLQYKLRQLAIR